VVTKFLAECLYLLLRRVSFCLGLCLGLGHGFEYMRPAVHQGSGSSVGGCQVRRASCDATISKS
jgi:hypothetical protein